MNIQIVKYSKQLTVDNGRENVVLCGQRNKSLTTRNANTTVDFLIHNQIVCFGAKVGTLCYQIVNLRVCMKALIHGLVSLSGSHNVPTFAFFVVKEPDSFMNTSLRAYLRISQIIPSAISVEVA